MSLFKITVTAKLPREQWDPDDQADDPTGTHEIGAPDKEAALDKFHSTVPIACLDDFEITCEEGIAL